MTVIIDIPDEVYNFIIQKGHLPYGINIASSIIVGKVVPKGGVDCMDEDAKQASIPYTYDAPKHDWKCGYPDITKGTEQ